MTQPAWYGPPAPYSSAIHTLPDGNVLHAEGLLISSALERLPAFYAARSHVGSADFFRSHFGLVWRAFEELDDAGALDEVPRDAPAELLRKFIAAKVLTDFRGQDRFRPSVSSLESWFVDLDTFGCATSPAELERTARRVREAARCRALDRALHEARVQLAYASADPRAGYLAAARRIEAALVEPSGPGDRRATASDAARSAWASVLARSAALARGEQRPTSGSGLFDALAGGLHPGDLWIVGGRPGAGKTAYALEMVRVAASAGSGCVLFSLEMTTEQVMQRMASAESGVFLSKLKSGALEERDWAPAQQAYAHLDRLPFVVDDTGAIAVEEICARAHRDAARWARDFGAERPLRLVVVDYAQVVGSTARAENENVRLGHVSNQLKALAKSLKITVLLLSQLGRDVERRKDTEMRMSDVVGSGKLEADADVLALLRQKSKDAVREVEAHVVKSRHGGEGIYAYVFDGRVQTFRPIE